MTTPEEILKRYWNFSSFRDKQKEIIASVLDEKDTLALLPTGGGKSICYQVPGLMMEGVCIVISPLIALMEDQVTHLRAKNINAVAIHSGMSKRQIDIVLDNAIYGRTKFLYVSPERLKTRIFKARFAKMKVNLVAIDEAHCISQWGYDFRPSYLDIAQLREIHPAIPFLALTATATLDVVDDIQEQLQFIDKNAIHKSFERKNLTYNVALTNNKFNRIDTFLRGAQGSGIIYCSTRRKVKELFIKLNEKGYSVNYYHAGLTYDERKIKQENWTQNRTQIIISTNAFGMGIDKPDVEFVLHHDIPASLEAYFQEAGRAGRNGEPAQAWLFYEAEDVHQLSKNLALKYPPIETIKRIYNALGNHLQLAIGSGKEETYPLDLAFFAEKYSQPLMLVYNALKFLELCDFIQLSEGYKQPSQLKILATNKELYNYQVRDKVLDKIILFILRTEMGVFDDYVRVNEYKIATKTGYSRKVVTEKLMLLTQLDLADYIPKSELPTITFTTERLADNNLSISPKLYRERKIIAEKKLAAVTKFLTADRCKSELLLHYFGEVDTQPCGKCHSCVDSSENLESIETIIKKEASEILKNNEKVMIIDLVNRLEDYSEDLILENLRWMAEHDEIIMGSLGKSFVLNG